MTKEEKKDEMKNRISMALKDPILQQGFEIICKENEQIEHLREERNYFQEKCEDIELNYYCDRICGCKVQKLEKENAELKAQVNEWLNTYSDTSIVKVLRDCIYKNEKLSSQEQQELSAWVECAMDFGRNLDECADQLTKAKEIIKTLADDLSMYSGNYQKELLEARQFIKEIEK